MEEINKVIQQKKGELDSLHSYRHELERQLSQITNSKFYETWQKICLFKKQILNPNLLFLRVKEKIPLETRSKIKKVASYFDFSEKEFEKYKNILLAQKNNEEKIKTINTKVSIIIPAKNAGPLFELVLKKITLQKYIKETEIIVLDSGSTDDTLFLAKKFGAKIINIKPEDYSHSSTRNIGAKHATGEYLLFTVQDAFFLNDKTIYDMVNFLNKTNSVAGSVRQIPRSDADIYASWQINDFTKFISPNKQDIFVSIDRKKFIKLSPEKKRVFCTIDDVCSIFIKKKFKQIAGFDEKLKFGEDLEIGKRIIESSGRIFYLCSNGVIHSHTRPPRYSLKRRYVENVFLETVFPKDRAIKSHTEYHPRAILQNILEIGKKIEREYSKEKTFDSLKFIEEIIFKLKPETNSEIKQSAESINELQIKFNQFIQHSLNALNSFNKTENMNQSDLSLLIDHIFSIYVASILSEYFLKDQKNPKSIELNNILESGV